jgi:hypothetical protein
MARDPIKQREAAAPFDARHPGYRADATRRSQAKRGGYPAEPLVSYQINRQLSGWNLPPLVFRAFGAHCQ